MADENLSYEDLLRIVELVKASEQFSEFRLKVGEIEIELRRRAPSMPGTPGAAPSVPAQAAPPVASPGQPSPPLTRGAATQAPSPAREAPAWPEESPVIRAPMVGTFYRAPQPGAPPFVELGQHVEPDTIVCIIEVMKLMNSIPADARGTVMHILVADAAPVEAGQPLIVLQPSAEPE